MDVGIGIPNAVPGLEREQLLEFARRAEARGFSSLGTIDRVAYPNWEPLAALAAAAAVTERIRLMTSILIAPLRETRWLAKQAATVDQISGGRLVLGVAPGGREDDFDAVGAEFANRGDRFDRQLEDLRRAWSSGPVGPSSVSSDGVPLLLGGSVAAAYRRAAEHGIGWIMGGGSPEQFADGAQRTRAAWEKAGRDGSPHLAALAYFSLGPDADERASAYLGDYYAWLGDEIAGMITGGAATDPETVKGYLQAFESAGCGELILFPCSADPAQVDLLADACGL